MIDNDLSADAQESRASPEPKVDAAEESRSIPLHNEVDLREAQPPLPELVGRGPRVIQFPPGRHKVWLATLLSFLVMGAGQMYNRQYAKGLIALAAGVLLSQSRSLALFVWAALAL